MTPEERERLEQELFEHLHGCAEDPAALEERLARDPEARALLEALRAEAELLHAAAREDASRVAFARPDAGPQAVPAVTAPGAARPTANDGVRSRPAQAAPARTRRRGLPTWARRGAGVLSLLLVTFGIAAPWARFALRDGSADTLEEQSLRLVLSGPSGVPAGTPAQVRVQAWDATGDAVAADLAWTAYDADERPLASGTLPAASAGLVSLPAELTATRRVEVTGTRGSTRVRAELFLQPLRTTPLAHLSTDKAVHRPGEVVRLRAVVLDRLTLEPQEGTARLRVVDPKGAPVESWWVHAEQGVASLEWLVPEDAAGGRYALELRDREDAFAVETLPLEVRRFQPPQLVQDLTLDRTTYAPGQRGSGELVVSRVTGGPSAGAQVDASLLVDGERVWRELLTLDERGRATFAFQVPERVERGEARLVARVHDGGVVETVLEPFVVPTGTLAVTFFPEGGPLAANVASRVYVEVRDGLGRPVETHGVVRDTRGRAVAHLEPTHLGRGRFALEPLPGETYTLELADEGGRFELPPAELDAVRLATTADGYGAGAPITLDVHTPGPGPWIAGVFCRGVLVAQEAFQGAGAHSLSLDVDVDLAGVLRVTVFDRERRPVAERLVHRASGRAVRVAVTPEHAHPLPGTTQALDLVTTDERGRPVSAVLGVRVSDRAVAAQGDEHRLGLFDAAFLTADLTDLEDLHELLGEGPEHARDVDLALGTRGWRRFGWLDPEALVAEHGDAARRLLVREGRSDVPRVADVGEGVGALRAARREARAAGRTARGLSVLSLGLLGLLGLWLLTGMLPAFRGRPLLAAAPLLVLLLVGYGVLLRTSAPWADGVAGEVFREAALEAPGAEAGGGVWLDDGENPLAALGYDGLDWGEEEEGRRLDLDVLRDALGNEALGGEWRAFARGVAAEPGAPLTETAVHEVEATGEELVGFLDDGDGTFEELSASTRRPAGRGQWSRVYAHVNPRAPEDPRADFTETVYWNTLLISGADGRVRASFDLSDRATTWDVAVDAHGAGRVGQATAAFEAVPPLTLEALLPVELTCGDRVELPVSVACVDPGVALAQVAADARGTLTAIGTPPGTLALTNGRGRYLLEVAAGDVPGPGILGVGGSIPGWVDRAAGTVRVVPRGFPHAVSTSGVVEDALEFQVAVPEAFVAGSLEARLVLYPSPVTDLLQGLEGILQEPHGCFEQASATHYPNVLAVAFLEAAGIEAPAAMGRARGFLRSGLDRLVGYECSDHGFEWFGADPPHEALTAYGLLEFHDTAQVMELPGDLLERTRAWVLSRRDGEGGYLRNAKALDRFGAAPEGITNAYLTYSLALTGTAPEELAGELDRLEERGLESMDPYEVALAAAALQAAGRLAPADAARDRLRTMQAEDGHLSGTTTSITGSAGDDLVVETTALGILAWLDDADDASAVRRAVEFLLTCRQGSGRFGATQATIQALRALTAYARDQRRVANAGELRVFVDDREVTTLAFAAGEQEPLLPTGLLEHLSPGAHRVRLELTGGNRFPFAFDLRYFAEQPADDPDAPLAVRTRLLDGAPLEGETVGVEVTVTNRLDAGLPMGLVVVGLPAGLECPTRVLDDLREAGALDLWERRGRELVLYWRAFAPRAEHVLRLDCVARVPGRTTGPASRAYPYYEPDRRVWATPLVVEIAAQR